MAVQRQLRDPSPVARVGLIVARAGQNTPGGEEEVPHGVLLIEVQKVGAGVQVGSPKQLRRILKTVPVTSMVLSVKTLDLGKRH